MKEDVDNIEKQIGSIKGWQKIIMLALLILAAMWELDVTTI